MARRKKRAAPPAKEETPEKNKNIDRGTARFQFHQISADREVERMNNEILAIGEKLIKLINQSEENFRASVSAEVGNMTLEEFFNAGNMLDYGTPQTTAKFKALSPLHYEIKEDEETSAKMSAPKQALSRRNTRLDSRPIPGVFSTPAPESLPINKMFITPKVVPQPKQNHVVVYTANGSPYLLNMTTMKAKLPDDVPSSVSRSTRVTRSTRASKRQ